MHADVLFRLQQLEQLRLVFQVRTRRIPKRIARSTILLMEQIVDPRRVIPGKAKLFAN